VPAEDFLDACPAKIEARFYAKARRLGDQYEETFHTLDDTSGIEIADIKAARHEALLGKTE
jgi:hypothetical protein